MNYDILLGDRLSVLLGELRCVSDVQEITYEGTLIIAAPVYNGAVMRLNEKDKIKVLYFRESGMLAFFAEVLRFFSEGNLALAEIAIISKITKVQIRDFARVDASIPVAVHIPKDEQSEGYPSGVYIETLTKDISAGGFSALSPKRIEKGKIFLCEFFLNSEGEPVEAEAVVVRSEPDPEKPGMYMSCFNFVHMPESKRKMLVRYVFDIQRRQRKILSE